MKHCFAVCILFAIAAHGATADDYAFSWPLQTSGDSAAWQVELTPDVYAAVHREDLRDVAVVNAAGDAVPMALRPVQTATLALANEVELPAFTLPATADTATDSALHLQIERDADGRLRRLETNDTAPASMPATTDLLLDASAVKAPIDGLWLAWTESEAAVSAQFSVTGSDDLQHWRPLVSNAAILSLHQNGNSLGRHQIVLNGVRAAYLRLHRLDSGGTALPELHVRARTLAQSNLDQAARVWVDAKPQPTSAADTRTPANFYYRLPAALAIEALRLELGSDNSLARLRIANRVRPGDDANAWQTRAEFTAFRLRQDDSITGNDEVALSANARAQEWRVEPATPLDTPPSLRMAFRPDRFVFLAQGAGPYRLVAGSARAQRGDYPVDAALAQLRSRLGAEWQPPLATLGTRVTLQGEAALTPPQTRRDWKTWLLWAVLLGAAALIGGLALSLLRKSGT